MISADFQRICGVSENFEICYSHAWIWSCNSKKSKPEGRKVISKLLALPCCTFAIVIGNACENDVTLFTSAWQPFHEKQQQFAFRYHKFNSVLISQNGSNLIWAFVTWKISTLTLYFRQIYYLSCYNLFTRSPQSTTV